MSPRIILDTGPLIAFLNARDGHHEWAREQWARVKPPFLTCDAVIAEACLLAGHLACGADEAVVSLVERGVLDLSFRLGDEAVAVARMMRKYRTEMYRCPWGTRASCECRNSTRRAWC